MNPKTMKRYVSERAGVAAVYLELAYQGYTVSVTDKNAPGVDILAMAPDGRVISIQVKATQAKPTWWPVRENATIPTGRTYFVFVALNGRGKQSDFWIVPSRTVSETSREFGTWHGWGRDDAYRERWGLLDGDGGG